MTIKANTTVVKASFDCTDQKTVSGFTPATEQATVSFNVAPNTTTYNRVLLAYGTLAAAANTTLDLYSWTSQMGESVTATKLAGYEFKAAPNSTSALGGQFRLEPGATNPATLFMGGTGPYLLANVNTNGCCFMVMSGSHEVVSNTVRNVLISNPGTNTIIFTAFALLGD